MGSDRSQKGAKVDGKETNRESSVLAVAMPHFTVTKVEDAEEGAAAPGSQEGEPRPAEIKAPSQHSHEPGEYSAWELWKTGGLVKEIVAKIFNMPREEWRKRIVVQVLFSQLFHSFV